MASWQRQASMHPYLPAQRRPAAAGILDDEFQRSLRSGIGLQRLGYRPESAGSPGSAVPRHHRVARGPIPAGPGADREASRQRQASPADRGALQAMLKEQLDSTGYGIGKLHPRRTRRATAVNWCLPGLAGCGEPLRRTGRLPAAAPAL